MSITESESYYKHDVAPLPDFSAYGYRVVQELEHNEVGDRSTYLATQLSIDHYLNSNK